MSDKFVHSVPVPRIYKLTADVVRRVREDGASLKTLIYEKKHPNVSGILGLSTNTLQVLPQLDQLLDRSQILKEQPRLNPWLARVLITELLWRKGCLKGCSKPILTVLTYESKLREELKNLTSCSITTGTLATAENKVRKPRYVRINTLLLSVEKAISLFQQDGWELLPKSTMYSSYLQSLSQLSKPYFIQDLHIPEVFAFPPSTLFYKHNSYQTGEILLQDKASCLPVHLLDVSSNSVVLDMCAAPGMKTTHIAAKLQNHGKVYAVEIDAKRFQTLLSQIKKTNSFCVVPIHQDVLTLDPKQYFDIEYILVDPSCSGSGIVDRLKQMDDKLDLKRLQNLQSFQVYLLRYALFNFPNVKKVIYSTCSLYPEENEQVVDEVLADIGNAYRLLPVKQLLENNWINFSSKKYNCGDACLYSRPNDDFCNGFFIAVFERNFDVCLPERKKNNEYKNPIKTNLNIKMNYMTEKVVCTQEQNKEQIRKKNKKRKKKKEILFPMAELEVETKTQTSEKEIEKLDNYDNLRYFDYNWTESNEKDMLEEIKTEKLRKKLKVIT